MLDSRPTVAWPPTTVAWPFGEFYKKFPNCLKRPKNVVWQSADGRVTSDHCRVTVQRLFFKNFPKLLETSKKRCLTVGRRSRDLRPLSRDRSATFFKIFSNCLKRPKNVVWQSADGRVTSTTVAWPLSDFFQNFPKSLETSKKRCFTVGRRSRDLRPLSRDRSATFFKIFPNCLKRLKNVVRQSADGRVTSDHCRVTVQRLLSKFSQIAWNVQKTLFDSRPTVAWPPTTVAWPFSDFFSKIFLIAWNVQKTLFDSRPTVAWLQPLSRDRSATFSKFSQIAWNVQKTLFDSRPTVAWPPTTVAWPFSDFFQKIFYLLESSKTRCLTVGRRSRDLTIVAWPFSDFFQNSPKSLETSKKRCLTVSRRSRDLRPLSRDRSATFFKIFPNRLKRLKNVVWQSADGRVTSDHCRVTVQRLFPKNF